MSRQFDHDKHILSEAVGMTDEEVDTKLKEMLERLGDRYKKSRIIEDIVTNYTDPVEIAMLAWTYGQAVARMW